MKEDTIQIYVSKIIAEFNSGQATEHAYRPALKFLFESLVPKLQAINDPKHSEHGAPDFALMRSRELSAGYAEAKDLKVILDETEKGEQMGRYLEYGSLILTNYLEFRFYRHGNKYGEPIIIARIIGNEIVPNERAYPDLEDAIRTFLTQTEAITSSTKLAEIMGDKARRIRSKVSEYVSDSHERNEDIRRMYDSFKKILIHDLTEEQFSDMYAQTLVYGLFAARYEDKTPRDFTRQEARDLVPHSNPFLRGFFDHIAGANFDIRLSIIVNELCEVFRNADVHALMHQYATQKGLLGDDKESADPVIHFYEDFLKEYDFEQRKKLGAFYTPLPVVRFIIRATDYLLEKEFGLAGGLSNTSKIEIKTTKQGKTAKESIHKVQILDPATGTGTFLNETVKHIFSRFKGQEGRLQSYVENDLLPRLHGFELMMAPYTIAHLKIAMTLHDHCITGLNHRLGVYLTNSLEEGVKLEDSLFGFGFGQSITDESKAASKIKNETPIMVVVGNPPYSVSSSNKGEWIQELIKDYKKDLGERKINLDDDYIKFLRFSEHFIEKNGSGIVAMITNNSFIDGITHRQMRKHLLETFDDVYILDLHGNSKKYEKAPDGGKDENVFDIQQGVSISICVRKEGKKSGLGKVYHAELWGKRENKFDSLNKSDLVTMKWNALKYSEPYYFFVPKDFGESKEYKGGFDLNELLAVNSSGVETQNDKVNIFFTSTDAEIVLNDFITVDELELKRKYDLADGRDWKIGTAKADLSKNEIKSKDIQYRPFDSRFTNFTGVTKGNMAYPRFEVMKNFVNQNVGLIFKRGFSEDKSAPGFASKYIIDRRSWSRAGMQGAEVIAPLYLYADDGSRVPNLKKEIVEQIEKIVGKVSPEDIFDYIYAVLHSPTYREKYKEFLKIDFPRVPYPKDTGSFKSLVALGKELRELHLMESPKLNDYAKLTSFPEAGNDMVEAKYPKYENGKVFINKTQYFGGVPEIAWNFYIGGYQPAQKWLKDRRERKLTSDDIIHYQKLVMVLVETGRVMGEIDKI
ncbi:MAG: type ISP restriction/modification enzyme [Candidatus Paceibacterota bacterium]